MSASSWKSNRLNRRQKNGNWFVWAVGIALTAVCPTTGQSGLVVAVQNVKGPTNGEGSFEVSLTDPLDSSSSFHVAGFTIELSVGQGAQFTGVTTATTAFPYIFAGTGVASIDPSFSFSDATFPNTTFTAADTEFTYPAITLNPGDTYGLARVTYSVSSGATGTIPITFQAATSVSDANGSAIAFTTSGGLITISSVPEPSALVISGIGLCTVALAYLRWRHSAPASRVAGPLSD